MEGQIFGPNVSLPCLPGLKSGCEEELHLLLKEIDLEFQRKHHELLEELLNARTLCRAQSDEINKLSNLLLDNQVSQNEPLSEKLKQYSSDLEKLKKENIELKSENNALQRKVQWSSDMQHQLESLKASLSIQQKENKVLQDKLLHSEEQYQSLKKVFDSLTSSRYNDGIHDGKNQVDDLHVPSAKELDIAQTVEKFMSEEKESHEEFISKINKQIDNVDKAFRKELS